MFSGIARICFLLAAFFLVGCREPKQSQPTGSQSAGSPGVVVKLTLQVVGDEQLAEGARLLRGEWKAHGGGEFDVRPVDLKSFLGMQDIAADVVIFPSRLLGALVENKLLRPVRSSVLENPQFALHEIFPAVRNGEMKFGGETWALPLGSPPLFLFLQTQETSENKLVELPQTWEQYRTWLGIGASNPKRAATPLLGRNAACLLIARAMAYTEVQRRHEAIFDPSTMKPRITEPTFVRALSELLEEAGGDVAKSPADFSAGLMQLHRGEAASAFGWPGLLREAKSSPVIRENSIVTPLPVSEHVYTAAGNRWENQIFRQSITLLGVEGRLVAVTASSHNAVSAFQLAQWLTTGSPAVQLSSRSHGALWFRSSQASAYARWLKGDVVSAAQTPSLVELVSAALSTESPLMIPRVPSIDEYLALLGDAIHAAKRGEAGAQAALNSAAAAWETLTDRLGRQPQATAYRHHLGIESMAETKR